jgi:hypothetical protein
VGPACRLETDRGVCEGGPHALQIKRAGSEVSIREEVVSAAEVDKRLAPLVRSLLDELYPTLAESLDNAGQLNLVEKHLYLLHLTLRPLVTDRCRSSPLHS